MNRNNPAKELNSTIGVSILGHKGYRAVVVFDTTKLHSPETLEDSMLAYIFFGYESDYLCPGERYVAQASVAKNGWGPLTYEIAMQVTQDDRMGGLIPDRHQISEDGMKIWKRFYLRNDINKTPLEGAVLWGEAFLDHSYTLQTRIPIHAAKYRARKFLKKIFPYPGEAETLLWEEGEAWFNNEFDGGRYRPFTPIRNPETRSPDKRIQSLLRDIKYHPTEDNILQLISEARRQNQRVLLLIKNSSTYRRGAPNEISFPIIQGHYPLRKPPAEPIARTVMLLSGPPLSAKVVTPLSEVSYNALDYPSWKYLGMCFIDPFDILDIELVDEEDLRFPAPSERSGEIHDASVALAIFGLDTYGRTSDRRENPDKETQQLLRNYLSGGDRDSLMKYIRVLERSGELESGDPKIIKQYVWACDQAGTLDDHHDEIFDGMAKGFFVYAWASEMDQAELSPGGDYYYNSPETPESAIEYAKKYEKKLVKDIKISLNGFYQFTKKIMSPNYDRDMTPEHFGFLIASSAAGHGTGLWEAIPSNLSDYSEVPYGEDYELWICENCGHPEPDDDHECP